MSKNTVKTIIVVLMLLTVALYFIAGTYARYSSSSTGTATADVAKWSVKVGGKPIEETFELNLTESEENEFITSGKFAPTSTLTSEGLTLDLTGTEVAVDLTATVDDADLKAKIGEGDSKITTELKYGEETIQSGEVKTIPLKDIGSKEIKVTVKWDNNDDQHNSSDTKIGIADQDLSIPVTLKVEQHIKS